MLRSVLTTVLLATAALAQGAGMRPSQILQIKDEAARMDDKIGTQIPLDLEFTDERGYPFALQQWFPGEQPVILILGYYTCPAMCGQVLGAALEALGEVDLEPGKDYRILNVSIDPNETAATANTRKQSFLPKINRVGADEAWRVCVGDEPNIAPLADAVGFHYYWSTAAKQFSHPPALVFLTAKGVVSRTIVNSVFEPGDLRLALVEASEGKLGTFWDQVRLNCLTFDSRANTYTMTAGTIMRLGGAVTFVAIATMIIVFLRKERRAARAATA